VKRCALVGGLAAQQNDETLEGVKSERGLWLTSLVRPGPTAPRGSSEEKRRRVLLERRRVRETLRSGQSSAPVRCRVSLPRRRSR